VDGAFQLVGALWDRGQQLTSSSRIEVRAHTTAGWSEWTPLSASDTTPENGTVEAAQLRPSAEPIWFGDSDRAEARVTVGTVPKGMKLLTIRGTTTAALGAPTGAVPRSAVAAAAATPAPFFYSRDQWGADDAMKPADCQTPRYTSAVKVVFIHHTVDSNTYASADVPSMLRSIYRYQLSAGWCDIAYNSLIDRFGQIWEGRSGGLDQPVLSGATGGFNTSSWAVSLLGNNQTATVSTATYNALRDLIAWKLQVSQLNAVGTNSLTQSAGGAGVGARWADGSTHTFNVISGHRDAVFTECPGDYAYAVIARLRGDVDAKMGANPFGNFEGVSSGFRSLTVNGWALDPETVDPTYVWVDVDGSGAPALANSTRRDVGAAFPGKGESHGFSLTVLTEPGAHKVCLTAVNAGAGHDSSLGCRWVAVSADPLGSVDAVSAVAGGIKVSGWVLDPETSTSTYVWIDVSGAGGPALGNVQRRDVAATYPGVGDRHGFSTTLAKPAGIYTVCAWAVNWGYGSDTSIGCRRVTVS